VTGDQLRAQLAKVLTILPGLTVRQLCVKLSAAHGHQYDKHDINRILYGNPQQFERTNDAVPAWHLRVASEPPVVVAPIMSPRQSALELRLWPWQQRALVAWNESNFRGVVEAVTGTGKSHVGLAAAATAAGEGIPTVVLVPTVELQQQWERLASRVLPTLTVGLLGDGQSDSLDVCDILIATAQTASARDLVPPSKEVLVVADECHRYGSPGWRDALDSTFGLRLGLTATYERKDDGIKEVLDPYFGGVCYSLGYEEALEDAVIAPFKIAIVNVTLNSGERRQYEDLAD